MKRILFTSFSLFLLATSFVSSSNAQDTTIRRTMEVEPPLFSGISGFRKWSIGFNGGALAPFVATGSKNDFSKWEPKIGYGAYIKYQLSHTLGIQADFMRGILEANNNKLLNGAPPVSPYRSFETAVNWAASLSGVITLGNINWSQLHTTIQPYASVGGGGINFSPTTVNNAGVTETLKPKKSYTEFFVPVGFGLRANLTNSVNLDLGYKMGFVDGDNLDGYFKAPFLNDAFSYAHIGLEFALGNKSKPQLARHNPPAQMAKNIKEGDDMLRASLAASEERYNQRLNELNGLKDDLKRMKMDSDGDGVSDYFDKCPNTPRTDKVDGAGCTLPVVNVVSQRDTIVRIDNTYVITEDDRRIVTDTFRNLEFETGKYIIKTRSFPYLDKLASLLKQRGIWLTLKGHTDNVGSDASNQTLSENRANSVKNYLVGKGANGDKIEANGFGESKPIETNKTAKGRQANRRVEFHIYTK